MAKGTGRKVGRGKTKPSVGKWKTNYSAGRGLKHRRKARALATENYVLRHGLLNRKSMERISQELDTPIEDLAPRFPL